MNRTKTWTAVAVVLASCPGPNAQRGTTTVKPPATQPATMKAAASWEAAHPGLAFTVESTSGGAAGAEGAKVAEATPLSDADADKILARMAPLVADPADQQPF